MANASDNLLKLIHETKAVSIWNREKGPVFWYTAGVPGPFFVNTEWVIGRDLATSLVDEISKILDSNSEPAIRAQCLNELILKTYEATPAFKQVITIMVEKVNAEFAPDSYTMISGGERRDWLFSIPLAKELSAKHAFLFKDQSIYCEQPMEKAEAALHVADLINNAASYFDRWLPALEKAQLHCAGTVCVNSRGTGAEKLEKMGIKTVALARVDVDFFQQFFAQGLIDRPTLDEIACHARVPGEWAEKYLLTNPDVFNVAQTDKKSFERLQSFFTQDPWSLREKHAAIFDSMQQAIAARNRNAA